MDNRFENFTVTVLRLNKLVQKIKLFEMKDYGLKAIHVMCIYYLDGKADGLTASELTRLTLEDKAAISRAVALLRKKGYVNYDNGYNAPIRLTDEGRKVAQFIDDRADRAVAAAGAELTDGERAVFYKCLGSIAENLQSYYDRLTEKENK